MATATLRLGATSGLHAVGRRSAFRASWCSTSSSTSTHPGEPARIFQMGLHHYGFWVDDVDPILARVEAADVPVLLNGSVGADSVW